MRVFIVLIWCFWFVGVDAQNRSIVFREGNWEKILKQAKKEKKLIFVDCYTSWCGPCKMLAKNVFTQDKVLIFIILNLSVSKWIWKKERDRHWPKSMKYRLPTLFVYR